jgi:hypothetical protein
VPAASLGCEPTAAKGGGAGFSRKGHGPWAKDPPKRAQGGQLSQVSRRRHGLARPWNECARGEISVAAPGVVRLA